MTIQAYTIRQIAEMLQSSESTILREIQHGRLVGLSCAGACRAWRDGRITWDGTAWRLAEGRRRAA